jgi:hypothetical protein
MTTSVRYEKKIRLPFGIPAPALIFVESHFESFPVADHADVFACLFQPKPLSGWRSYEGQTRVIDLHAELDAIFARFAKGTRYDIKRAKRDGIETSVVASPTQGQLEEFMDYFDRFAGSKGVPRIHRAQLRAFASAMKLGLSFARSADGAVLAAHAYLLTDRRARLTHSASLFRLEQVPAARSRIGRANRLLHWDDLSTFRTMGTQWYDFGGWYHGSRNEALLKINAFKEEFGGELVKEWSCFKAGSRLGWLYVALRDLMLRRKK